MFSPEFMRFLINYQDEEYTPAKKEETQKVKYFSFSFKNRFMASVSLLCKR